ncbi:MAG: capsular biosynthesis protein [Gammaproteobacteria bacterium]|nr:capsular biosynthesis protein [Gammaproteobacteria bacterium]MBU1654553.1 capsular biosynthesis protein [Gammaproteobacteria bacterium]MBU1961945.1 capsular biosynthesis protein [Gammaproteobacteria bacterium]
MADGHRLFKINFNAGDWVYWGGRPAWNYRGKVSGLRDYLDEKYRKFGITDQVLFGDRRPVHRPAVEHGASCGVRTHVFEEGYFRPHWVTLEREGVNGHSLLPRDPAWFWEAGAKLPAAETAAPFQSSFRIRAFHDVLYHSHGVWNPLFFPGYRTHATVPAPVEYAGYIRRLSMLRFHRQRDNALITGLVVRNIPFYLLPLQLNSDAQIRDHSRFDGMAEVMAFVMESFSRFAPGTARLVIKNHPLDMGLENYPRIIANLEKRFGLSGRVDYLETGDLELLLRHAQGVVTVNSTVGNLSLGFGCPTITLSDPVYNLPGLTFQGNLGDFWQAREKPDAELFRRFRQTLIHTSQVNGGFYCPRGIELAVENSRRLLEAERPPWEGLL